MNLWLGDGNLASDAEMRVSRGTQRAYATALLACDRGRDAEPEYIPLRVFASDRDPKRVQTFVELARKGRYMVVRGHLNTREVIQSANGEHNMVSNVVVEEWRIPAVDGEPKKGPTRTEGARPRTAAPAGETKEAPETPPPPAVDPTGLGGF